MASASAQVETAGIRAKQQRFVRLLNLTTDVLKVGWPEESDEVTGEVAQRAHWLEHGTRNQDERPFLEIVSNQIRNAPGFRDDIIRIIAGSETIDQFWDTVGADTRRRILQELQRMKQTHPLEKSTRERKRRKPGVPFPDEVGFETGEMLSQLTWIVVDVRN